MAAGEPGFARLTRTSTALGCRASSGPASIDSGTGAPTTVKGSPGVGLGDPGCRHAWSAFGSCGVTVPAAPSTVTS